MPFERLKEKAEKVISPVRDFVERTRQQLLLLEEMEAETTPSPQSNSFLRNGETFVVKYVPYQELAPLFGCAIQWGNINHAHIRNDLPEDIQRFVKSHELFHLIDDSEWGGWVGRELRANLIPGLKDPVGLWKTIKATVQDKERRELYMGKIRMAISGVLADEESSVFRGF